MLVYCYYLSNSDPSGLFHKTLPANIFGARPNSLAHRLVYDVRPFVIKRSGVITRIRYKIVYLTTTRKRAPAPTTRRRAALPAARGLSSGMYEVVGNQNFIQGSSVIKTTPPPLRERERDTGNPYQTSEANKLNQL